jgi:DNA-binding response OmpR family regulator/AraC-like DNA-binding protein
MNRSAWTREANAIWLRRVLPHSLSPRRLGAIGDSLRRDQESRTSTADFTNRQRLLWVDDEPALMAPLAAYLTEQGFDVEFAASGAAGLSMAVSGTYAAILLDVKLPDIDGIELIQQLHSAGVDTPVIVITGLGSTESAIRAGRCGAADMKLKPLRGSDLLQTIRSVLANVTHARRPTTLFREPVGEGPSTSVRSIILHLSEMTDVTETRGINTWPEVRSALRKALAQAVPDPELTLLEFCAVAEGLRLISSDVRLWPRLELQHTLNRLEASSRCDWRRLDARARRLLLNLVGAGKACLHLNEDALARELGLDPDILSSLPRVAFGLSIRQLRRVIIMRRAVQMLAASDEQVAQIAYAVGYEHPSAFNHSFASFFGLSPRSCRRLNGTRGRYVQAAQPKWP